MNIPMNIPVMEKWIERLRSGKYKQGKTVLRFEDDTYCCLGVLCDLAVEAKVIPSPVLSDVKYGGKKPYLYEGIRGVLSSTVAKWAGISSNPIMRTVLLSSANDKGTTFEEIADLIQGEVNDQLKGEQNGGINE